MAKKCEFVIKEDQLTFRTRSNGDHVQMDGMEIDADNAADLAYLIQSAVNLQITIKEASP